MVPYKSRSGKESGVMGYEIGENFIIVRFNNSERYSYSYKSAGKLAVETMKKLALSFKGLSTFIAQNKPAFEKRF